MKKKTIIASVIAAVVAVSAVSVTSAFAVSNPKDDAAQYSYNAGQSAYKARMSASGYSEDDTVSNESYSFNTGRNNAQNRKNAYTALPENATDEQLAEFYENSGLGEGSAYTDGTYNTEAKGSYGYNTGKSSYQQRHAAFE